METIGVSRKGAPIADGAIGIVAGSDVHITKPFMGLFELGHLLGFRAFRVLQSSRLQMTVKTEGLLCHGAGENREKLCNDGQLAS